MTYVETLQFLDRPVSVGKPAKFGYARGIRRIEGPPEVWFVEVLFPDGEARLVSKTEEISLAK